MQPSELWRSGVVLPLDDAARKAIEDWAVTRDTRVQYVALEARAEALWTCGVFQALNDACGTLIDEYEEAWLPVSQVPAAQEVLASYTARAEAGSVVESLEALSSLLAASIRLRQPALFVL